MAVLSFSLSPEATGRVHELLICLARFADTVSLEARRDKLTLTALNSSRTAYASFALAANAFFIEYGFGTDGQASNADCFTCQFLNKPLQSVFKGRLPDLRGRDAGIERCDVTVLTPEHRADCRFVVKMLAKHGVTKTYRLTYQSSQVMHALFDKTAASQGFSISSRVLREYVEYFGPRTEQLDLLAQDGKVMFTSFTEKIHDGKEVLKQPLETAIAIHTEDFEHVHMQEGMHIVISVKDFRAIVTHAETLRGSIHASFSCPTRPLQFSYQNLGILCEFTLMTTGDRGASESFTVAPKFVSTRPAAATSRQLSAVPPQRSARSASDMPPPGRPSAGKPLLSQSQRSTTRCKPHPTAITVEDDDPDPESLFVPIAGGDDDQTWDPPNYGQDDDEMLGWDASNDNLSASIRPMVRDLNSQLGSNMGRNRALPGHQSGPQTQSTASGLAPTQRLSQLHGMFD